MLLSGPTAREGPGLSEERRRRVFGRFWRAPDAPKGGTGLGFALVQRHIGGCEVESAAPPYGGLDAVVRLSPAVRRGGTSAQGATPFLSYAGAVDRR